MNTEEMTIEQLRALKEHNYKTAIHDGTFEFLANLARHFGVYQSCSYGPKYKWENDDGNIVIFVDDYGHYMTVTVNGEKVASTHFCDQYIKSGNWFNEVHVFRGEVDRTIKKKQEEKEAKERAELLTMI